MDKTNMLEKSIIISAHPDDEVLWFSSIIDKVDRVVVCFLAIKSEPEVTTNREKCLQEHPIKNIHCLGIDESEAFFDVDWQNPAINEYGMEITRKRMSCNKYKNNYFTLKQHLENTLSGYCNVFTHNPWGEYGHVEHVQVYRVVKELQKKMKFNLWFSNYCSNKSLNLMLAYSTGMGSNYTTLRTNRVLANSIKDLYVQNRCWTWYSDWSWSSDESFIEDEYNQSEFLNLAKEPSSEDVSSQGYHKKSDHVFPLNFIKVKLLFNIDIKPTLIRTIYRKTRKLLTI